MKKIYKLNSFVILSIGCIVLAFTSCKTALVPQYVKLENVSKLKKNTTHEIYGALGYLASIDLVKPGDTNFNHLLKPKILLKYSPNHMKKETGDHSLHRKNIFSLDRLNSTSNYEGGTSLTYGFDYNQTGSNKLNFTIGQIINERKNNKNMPDSSSLDNRFSDIVGNFNYNKGGNIKIDYNYSQIHLNIII